MKYFSVIRVKLKGIYSFNGGQQGGVEIIFVVALLLLPAMV